MCMCAVIRAITDLNGAAVAARAVAHLLFLFFAESLSFLLSLLLLDDSDWVLCGGMELCQVRSWSR